MISWDEFEKVELRVGTILSAEPFPEARKPAYKLTIDFGEFGILRSSVQITKLYSLEELPGKQIVAVTNFPPKRIAGFESQVLVCGFDQSPGHVALTTADKPVPNGTRMY